MFDFVIQNRNGHLVGGIVLAPGKVRNFLVALNGAAFAPQVLFEDNLNVRI